MNDRLLEWYQTNKIIRNESGELDAPSDPGGEDFSRISSKQYLRFPFTELLSSDQSMAKPLLQILEQQKSPQVFSESNPLSIQEVTQLLNTCASKDESRTYSSVGQRYPVEIYVSSFKCGDLLPNYLYHYNVEGKKLEHLLDIPQGMTSANFVDKLENVSFAIVLTAMVSRVEEIYGLRAWPAIFIEAGIILQNLQLMAASLNIGASLVTRFAHDEISSAFDLSESEVPLATLAVGGLVSK